jgi:hypothetical protein
MDRLESFTGYNFLDRLPAAVETYWGAGVLRSRGRRARVGGAGART